MAWKLGNGKLAKDQTNHYGEVLGGGGGGITIDDFVDSDNIEFSAPSTGKVSADLSDDAKTDLITQAWYDKDGERQENNLTIIKLTLAEYNALTTKDANTLYIITE